MADPDKDLERPADAATQDLRGPVQPPPVPKPPDKIGPYVLKYLIGEGGMGAVYRAYHPELDRWVAVKLLRPGKDKEDTTRQERLLREAQSMARLSHPHVVAVHDAGVQDGRVFLVMEIVDGGTLRDWLGKEARPWRQVLRAFLEAGSGLSAAHAAGVVHRDFKPANVLVGKDGHPRVTDFGLAKSIGDATPVDGRAADEPSPARSLNSSAPLTHAGTVLGTPAYMAPEQLRGLPADPRSDQFSFCVALWESLYRKRPFGSQFDEVEGSPLPIPPPGSGVPRHVQSALLRGLAVDPAARFPSMDALLAELSREPGRNARRAVLGAAVAVGIVAALVVGVRWGRRAAAAGCADLGREWAGVWDEGARRDLRARLAAAQAPHAGEGTLRLLDAFAAPWSAERKATCEQAASKAPGDALLALTCLDRQKEEMVGLLQLFAQGDPEVLRNAVVAAGQLLPPARCRDPRALSQMPRLPADTATRLEVERLRVRLAAGVASYNAGREKDAAALIQPIARRAEELSYRPLQAEALRWLGLAQEDSNNAEALQTLTRAEETAEAAGLDSTAALAAAHLVTASFRSQPDDGRRWARRARILLERSPGDPLAEATLEAALSWISEMDGKDEEELAHSQRALALRTEALGADHMLTLRYLTNLGIDYVALKRHSEAVAPLRRAADGLTALGAEGVAAYALQPLATALTHLGQFHEAEEANARAAEFIRHYMGTDNQLYAESLLDQSDLRLEQGRAADALTSARLAEEIMSRSEGAESIGMADALAIEGAAQVQLRKSAEGSAMLIRALALYARDQRTDLAEALIPLAEARNDLRQWEAARESAEQAIEILKPHRANPGDVAWARFQLARALVGLGRERERATTLASQAQQELAAISWKDAQREAVERWAKANRVTLSGPR